MNREMAVGRGHYTMRFAAGKRKTMQVWGVYILLNVLETVARIVQIPLGLKSCHVIQENHLSSKWESTE